MLTRVEQFRKAMNQASFSTESPRRHVRLHRDETGAVTVRLERGTLARLSHRELTDEITGALSAGLAEYARVRRELIHRYLATSLEVLEQPSDPAATDRARSHRD